MKDSEFIELLNLYVDHEISAEQAARLESEVAGSAERRKMYRQYCMIHKACSLLTDTVLEEAPRASVRSATAGRDSRRFWGWSGGFYAAGLLSAACLALVLVAHHRHASPIETAPAVAQSEPAVPAIPGFPQSDLPVVIQLQQHPVSFPSPFGSGPLQTVLNTRAFTNPAVYTPDASPGATDAFAWMNNVNLAPIPHSVFEPMPEIKLAPILLPTADNPRIERAAWEFTR